MSKKTMVGAACILFAQFACAEVQISGQLQTQIVHHGKSTNATGGKGLYISDGGTFLGGEDDGNWGFLSFTAEEDLGDGLKALAKYTFNITNDVQRSTHDAYVGLSGDWGTLLGGRMNHPYKASTIGWDPFLDTFMQARGSGGMGDHYGILYFPEANNSLTYINNFNGVDLRASIIIDESHKAGTNKTNAKHAYAFSLNAPIGPIEVAFSHINYDKFMQYQGGFSKKANATKLGVKWSSNNIVLAGQVESLDKGLTGSGKKGTVGLITGSYTFGSNTLSASVGNTDKKAAGTAYGHPSNKAVKYAAIGLDHSFSKRTNVFLGYRVTDGGSGVKENAAGAGLRVMF